MGADCVDRAVTSPGDVVALESPTLFAFLEILEYLHLRALEIPTHPRTGFSLDALQLALDT
jgi:DNA-binding transcriptional MocR family regulator